MKRVKYFWSEAIGLNADIERHRKQKQELEGMIADLESRDQSDRMVQASLRAYRNFLYQLELSMAEVVSKIGKK